MLTRKDYLQIFSFTLAIGAFLALAWVIPA
jgi:hypothetical protein